MRHFLLILCLTTGLSLSAQVDEVNPLVDWNYVKSQEFEMTNGLWFNTDFPAEKGYEYIFIMNHKLDSVLASIQLYDMQDKLLDGKTTEISTNIIDLPFEPKESANYRIFFIVNDRKGDYNKYKVQLVLIRRKKL